VTPSLRRPSRQARCKHVNPSDQLPLFNDEPAAPVERVSRSGFLSLNSRVFDCLVQSKTLHRLVAQAAKSTARKHGSKRSSATPFEDAVKKLILDPDAAAKIAVDTIERYAERYPEARDLVLVELSDGPAKGDPLADLLIRFRFDKGRTVTVATNIKRLAPVTIKPEGGSLLSFVRLATEPNYDPANPPRNHGFDADGAVMEWYAGRRKILDGRDYYILACRVSAGKLHGIEAWGTLAGVDGAGRPIVTRHGNRAVIYATRPTGTIAPTMDINAELSGQLLPAATPHTLRAHLVALAVQRDGDEAGRALAATLLDLDDAELLDRLLAAINRD